MLQHPRLKYCYHAEFLEENRVFLLSEKDNTILSGELYRDVLAQVKEDGMTLPNLMSRLQDRYSFQEIVSALNVLESEGYLTGSTSCLSREESAYWNSIGIHSHTLPGILEAKPVSLEFLVDLPREIFLREFQRNGIKTGPGGELRVVVTDDYQREELGQINQTSIDANQPWMPVKPYGMELWFGPVFIPGETGCWECLRQRLRNNRPMDGLYSSLKNTGDLPPRPAAALHLTMQIAANQATLEIIKWLYFGRNNRVEGKIVTYDTRELTSREHVLVKRPQCSVCGEDQYKKGNRRHPLPITPQNKKETCICMQGGYREVPPEDTYEKYKHQISPITGVIQTLKPYFPHHGAPVYNYYSGINVAMQSKTLYWLNFHIRGTNGGKGSTWSQARAGAMCEAIERYSSTYQGDEYYIDGSFRDLGKDAIHPNACMNFSENQYRNREETNQKCPRFYALVPRPFDETLPMQWTPVYSLTKQAFKYLPSCFCYARCPEEDPFNCFCYPDTNGCAAGNSIEEAILQGFLELVERDSAALWWYNMLPKPAVDLHSFNHPYFFRLIEYYRKLNRNLYVLDLTADMQIPAFGAISHRGDGQKGEIIFGFGAHVDAKLAIERALVELNQILPIVQVPETMKEKGMYRIKDETFLHWLDTAFIENHPHLAADESIPMKKAADYPRLCRPNIYESLVFCINSAAGQGLEILVLDMTRPDIGLNVVKVMAPGLRHFWKRLAPGRLYDIPVKMGWLEKPLKEEELNPAGLFI
jgi:ribosomal protein S12 methylthiotransferase accessory factor